MARSSSTVLAALLAALPVVATAQTSTPAAGTPAPAADAATAPTPATQTDTAPAAVAPATDAQPADAGTAAPAADAGAADAAKPADGAAAEPAKTDAPAATEPATEAAAAPADAATTDAAATDAASTDAAKPDSAATDVKPDAAAPAASAPEGDQIGSYYTKSTHGDWLLRCLKTPDGKDPCELYQLLKDQGAKPVAEVSVIPFSGKAAAIVNFVAPLETDLPGGLGLQIDTGKTSRYPFLVCVPVGCIARVGMTQAELGALKNGSKANVSLLPFGADPAKDLVKLDMSLKGFTAGFGALQEQVKAEQAAAK